MAFIVQTNTDPDSYGDDARYELNGGALIVKDAERTVIYGPAGWLRVEVTSDHDQGGWAFGV